MNLAAHTSTALDLQKSAFNYLLLFLELCANGSFLEVAEVLDYLE